MNYFQSVSALFLVLSLSVSWKAVSSSGPCIIKTFGKPAANKALKNHVIRTSSATSAEVCELHCFMEITCQSYNFGPKEDGNHVCELNDSDAIRDPLEWTTKQGFIYGGTKNPCSDAECPVNSRCYSPADLEHDTYQCVCTVGFTGNNCQSEQKLNESCTELLENGLTSSGVYTISPDDGKPMQVLCDMTMDGGGWTVFQRRLDGSVDFYLDWESYKNGFGDLNGKFWLGNDNLHRLTAADDVILRVDLEDFDGDTRYAEYTTFKVADEADKYRLLIGGYSGTAGESFIYHNDTQFSTNDNDNDDWNNSCGCAQTFKGGWWYKMCLGANLNGLYLNGTHSSHADGVNWEDFRGFHYSLKRTEMKVKTKS